MTTIFGKILKEGHGLRTPLHIPLRCWLSASPCNVLSGTGLCDFISSLSSLTQESLADHCGKDAS